MSNVEEGGQRFAVVLNEQGRFAQTCVAGFNLLPEVGRHVWKGKLSETAAELAGQVNAALKAIADFGDPFLTIEILGVGERKDESGSQETRNEEIILEANRQLQEVIEQVTPAQRKLRVREPAADTAAATAR